MRGKGTQLLGLGTWATYYSLLQLTSYYYLVIPNFFHVRMMEATVILGTFNATDIFGIFPRSVPQHNPVLELYRQFITISR